MASGPRDPPWHGTRCAGTAREPLKGPALQPQGPAGLVIPGDLWRLAYERCTWSNPGDNFRFEGRPASETQRCPKALKDAYLGP